MGGCFAFFGGNAGLGDSGRLGGCRPIGLGGCRPIGLGVSAALAVVGACNIANGSLPNASAED